VKISLVEIEQLAEAAKNMKSLLIETFKEEFEIIRKDGGTLQVTSFIQPKIPVEFIEMNFVLLPKAGRR